jgi:hypothetical protein
VIDGLKGYITVNQQPDGTLGEVFVHGFGKLGSAVQGWSDAFAMLSSIMFQVAPFDVLAMLARKFAHQRFSPYGETDNPDIPWCSSVPDYVFRFIAKHYGTAQLNEELAAISKEMRR